MNIYTRLMKYFFKENSNYETLFTVIIISCATLLMLVASTASFLSSNYQHLYAAAKNTTNTTPSPIGSKTFLTVTTKVSGGTKKPSDFTVTVSGNGPSPKSFSGASSGTSVTLNAGKYKVSASGPTGYTTKYSSGCSGTASGGTPIKCTISAAISSPSQSQSPSPTSGNSNSTTKKAKSSAIGTLSINGFVKRSDCSDIISPRCPEVRDSSVRVTLLGHDQFGNPSYYPIYWDGSLSNEPRQISIPVGTPYAVLVDDPGWKGGGTFWKWEEGIIHGSCSGHVICNGTMPANGATITVDLYWACVGSPFGRC